MRTIERIGLALIVIGGLNWGLIGLFQWDLVAALFGGQEAAMSRFVYTLVGIGALCCLSLLFRRWEETDYDDRGAQSKNLRHGTEFSEELDRENSDER